MCAFLFLSWQLRLLTLSSKAQLQWSSTLLELCELVRRVNCQSSCIGDFIFTCVLFRLGYAFHNDHTPNAHCFKISKPALQASNYTFQQVYIDNRHNVHRTRLLYYDDTVPFSSLSQFVLHATLISFLNGFGRTFSPRSLVSLAPPPTCKELDCGLVPRKVF